MMSQLSIKSFKTSQFPTSLRSFRVSWFFAFSGLEPEIQKLISKHKQELKNLRTLHETELQQADERAAQHYARQCEELREQLQKEKEEQRQREQELAKHR